MNSPTTECRLCGRASSDAFACTSCTETARKDLTDIADLAIYLDGKRARTTTNWKPGTIGRAAAIPLPYDPRVSWVADPILAALRHTASLFRADPFDDSIAGLALWLISHCEGLSRMKAGPDKFAMFERASTGLFLLFDRPPDTHYIGPCGATIVDQPNPCSQDLYVGEGITALLCPTCSTLHQVTNRQTQLDASVANYLGTAKEISALCRHQFGDDVSTAMIRGYVRHGLIQTKGTRVEPTKTGDRESALFRIGDVREAVTLLNRDEKKHRRLKKEATRGVCA